VLERLRRLRREHRRKQLQEAAQILRLTNEANEAARRPRPMGWTSWPPISSGASRIAATLRPPSASRWK
jgi:hypothetical protein